MRKDHFLIILMQAQETFIQTTKYLIKCNVKSKNALKTIIVIFESKAPGASFKLKFQGTRRLHLQFLSFIKTFFRFHICIR